MPVLSEQMTLAQPRVSTAARRFTMACCCAILETPIARVTAVTAGSPSGIAATASATAVNSTSLAGWPRAIPIANTAVTIPPAIIARLRESRSSCFWSGVFSLDVDRRRSANWPTSVSIPVAVTTISPRPRLIVVFMNAMFNRSPIPTLSTSITSVFFATGWLSPVSVDS